MAASEPQPLDIRCSTTTTITPDLTHPRRRNTGESDGPRGSRDPSSCNEEPLRRSSAFLEVGLGGEDTIVDTKLRRDSRPKLQVRFRTKVDVVEPQAIDLSVESLPQPQMSPYFPTLPRLLFIALVIVLVAPSLHTSPVLVAEANPVRQKPESAGLAERSTLPQRVKRQNTQTDVCKRWSGQSAIVNGTLYYYGGRASTSADQTTNQWSMCRRNNLYPNTNILALQTMTSSQSISQNPGKSPPHR